MNKSPTFDNIILLATDKLKMKYDILAEFTYSRLVCNILSKDCFAIIDFHF